MNSLLLYLLQVILASGILYCYYHFFLRNKRFHRYNRFYIITATVISILVPFLNIPVYFTQNLVNSSLVLHTLSNISTPVYNADPVIINAPSHSWFSWQNVLYATYILIATLVLIRIILSLRKIRLIIKKNSVERIEKIRFVNTEEPGTPFSFFRWLFWNKKIELQSEKGEQIFRHELFHIEQKHSWDILFMELLTVIFWINPFFHLMKKELKAIHEFLADQFAVNENKKWEYAELLLMQALNTQNQLTHPFFHNQIKRRIVMLTSSSKPGHQYLRKVLVLPVAAIVLALFAFKYKEKMSEQEKMNDNSKNSLVMQDTTNPQSQMVLLRTVTKLGTSPAKKNPTADQLKNWGNSKIYGVWLDGKRIFNSSLSKYSASDISYYNISKLEKNAINYGKHYNQVDLMTENYYKKMVSNWDLEKKLWMNVLMSTDTLDPLVKKFQKPIIVIDGVVTDSSASNYIYPRQISSIRMSKGQTAIDKYGEKGSGGVIEITTKQDNDSNVNDTIPASKKSDENIIFEKTEVEPSFPGGEPAWKKCLERNLAGINSAIKGAPNGTYTVYVQFVVDKEGYISDVKALTHYGYGMEDAAINVIKKGPLWIPALQNGKKVKAYKKQPVTFVVMDGKASTSNTIIHEVTLEDKSKPQDSGFYKALFVVDGKITDNSVLQNINPENINSIQIIKGAPAIAKYGDKGRNGVIEITTKKINETTLPDKNSDDNKVFEKVELAPSFPGGHEAWKRYLERTLGGFNPADSGASAGEYPVIAQFIVDKEGNISDIKTLTHFGHAMEDKVIEIIKKGPKWEPAIQNGHKVKAYVKQPVTFVVQEEDPLAADSSLKEVTVTGYASEKSKTIPGNNQNKNSLKEVKIVGYASKTATNMFAKEDMDRLSAIYPNPTTNAITIPFKSETEGKGEIRIYDEMGNLKLNSSSSFMKGPNTLNVNVSSLAKGVYIVQLVDANKKMSNAYKLIKQ